MKFVELKDNRGELTLVNLDMVNEFRKEATTDKAAVFYESDSSSLGMTVAEVAAAIREQVGPGPCSGPPAPPAPEADVPIPLAVGQVWAMDRPDGYKARIDEIHDDKLMRTIINAEVFDKTTEMTVLSFRHHYKTLISPAPEPPSPEAPPDPVSLLAGGKRLRYVRDAGAISERIPAEVNAVLLSPAEDFHAVAFYSPGDFDYRAEDSGNYFLGDWNKAKQTGAISGLTFIKSLGYRFAGLAGEGA